MSESKVEFDLIKRYFSASRRSPRRDVVLSVGDDCAICEVQPNQHLAITTDTMVQGTHFYSNIDPADLAYKAVAVNLSDLASMGAEPAWVTLALTLPEVDHLWLARFSESFFDILDHYNVDLIGGDTTRGVLSVTISAHGLLPRDKGICRHQAHSGDWIYVTGSLGDSAKGFSLLTEGKNKTNCTVDEYYLIERHLRPTPRVLFGQTIVPFASAAIDISDGLLGDLAHIVERSNVSAVIDMNKIPLSPQLLNTTTLEQAQTLALTGGEDYELCFCVPDTLRTKMEKALTHIGVPYTCIGQIRPAKMESAVLLQRNGEIIPTPILSGYDHFGTQ
ncbi:thiamine-phosphate kinase [Spirabiliibacterium falconis]|uniref:thiamine-phosphate kinase n=1 Tax=Spirabiliibacterium falconis TaxID=572023 RepID=UPI001AACA88F|nr:thiamine-phosphate kinase [Spirabiliibacterium falconis]MBE2894131.1 thiamine-phosphate kinase [Spirabiliibacterium falconis]